MTTVAATRARTGTPEPPALIDLLEQASGALADRGGALPADFETYELMRTVAEQLAGIVRGQLLFGMTFRAYGPGSYPR